VSTQQCEPSCAGVFEEFSDGKPGRRENFPIITVPEAMRKSVPDTRSTQSNRDAQESQRFSVAPASRFLRAFLNRAQRGGMAILRRRGSRVVLRNRLNFGEQGQASGVGTTFFA